LGTRWIPVAPIGEPWGPMGSSRRWFPCQGQLLGGVPSLVTWVWSLTLVLPTALVLPVPIILAPPFLVSVLRNLFLCLAEFLPFIVVILPLTVSFNGVFSRCGFVLNVSLVISSVLCRFCRITASSASAHIASASWPLRLMPPLSASFRRKIEFCDRFKKSGEWPSRPMSLWLVCEDNVGWFKRNCET
jgi:hypothetical protein